MMKKAGGIIGLIAGIFGIIAGFVTLFMGGLAGAFNATGSETVVGLGWGGIGFSFLVIIFGAIAMSSKTRIPPTLLIASSIGGMILGGTLVAIVLVLGLLGGVIALFGNYPKDSLNTSINAEPSVSKSKNVLPFAIGGIVLIIMIAVFAFNKNDSENGEPVETAKNQRILDLENATPSDLLPYGELENIYALGGDYTDIQRDNKTEQIKDSIVDWSLEVFDVKKTNDGYKVQTSGQDLVGTFIKLSVRDDEEKAFVENLKTGDLIRVKAVIEDVSFRSIELSPAVLYREKLAVSQSSVTQNSDAVAQDETVIQPQEATNELGSSEVDESQTSVEETPLQTPISELSKPSFDCAKASTNIEKMICSNVELGNWDMKVSSAYSQDLTNSPQEYKATLKSQQQEWLKVRNKCTTIDCLVTEHQKRHMYLAPWDYEQHE